MSKDNSFPEAYLILQDKSIRRLKSEKVDIGRIPENDIQIKRPNISKTHAQLRVIDGKWHIEDLGSMNGTFLNKNKIEPRKPAPLVDDSEIHLANYPMQFKKGSPVDEGEISSTMAFSQEKDSRKDSIPLPPSPDKGHGTILASQQNIKENSKKSRIQGAYAYLELRSISEATKYPIKSETTKIGSDPKRCDLILRDKSVSPLHAEIRFDKNKTLFIKDLSSDRGTYVNQKRVKKLKIRSGDQIDIGDMSFNFHIDHWPDVKKKTKKKKKTGAGVWVIIIFLVLFVGAMSAFYYYSEYMASPLPGPQGNQKKTPQFTDVKNEILKNLGSRNFEGAKTYIAETLDNNKDLTLEQTDNLQKWRSEIELYQDIRYRFQHKDISGAYRKSREIPADSIIHDSMILSKKIKEIHDQHNSNLDNLESDIEKAVLNSNFTKARTDWQDLNEAIGSTSIRKVARLKDKINIGDRLHKTITGAEDDISGGRFETADENCSILLKDMEETLEADPDLKNFFKKDLEYLEDVIHHARFEKFYLEGDYGKSNEQFQQISYSYQKRDTLGLKIQNLKDVILLMTEMQDVKNRIVTGLKENEPEILNDFKLFLSKLEEIRKKDTNPRFMPYQMTKKAEREIKKLRIEYLKQQHNNIEPEGIFPNEVERLLARRCNLCKFLKMFPEKILFNPDEEDVKKDILEDETLIKYFNLARKDYDRTRSTIFSKLQKAYLERDPEYIQKSGNPAAKLDLYMRKLKEYSLVPYDADIDVQIDNFKKKYRERLEY